MLKDKSSSGHEPEGEASGPRIATTEFQSYCPLHSLVNIGKGERDVKIRSSNFALRNKEGQCNEDREHVHAPAINSIIRKLKYS